MSGKYKLEKFRSGYLRLGHVVSGYIRWG